MLIKALKIKEALDFSAEAVKSYPSKLEVLEWRAKACFYDGNDVLARRAINAAYDIDPDYAELQKLEKRIKKSTELKEKASQTFKAGNL